MHSFKISAIAAVATFFTVVASQSIDPSSVDIATREKWCDQQKASCPLICLQLPNTTAGTEANNCTAATLVYQCICSNGQSPNASQYSQTIPYFECTESANQCANNCNQGDNACVSNCRTAHPCGAQDPVRVNVSSSTTMAASASKTGDTAAQTSGGSAVYTGFGSSSTSSSKPGSSDAQALALGFGRVYGLAVVLATVFGAFTLL